MSKHVCLDHRGQAINPRNKGQLEMVHTISNREVTFVDGPAGTGKTFLTIAMAVSSLQNNQHSKLILVRPAVESGEKLGFLPGDIGEKVSPYMRPLYDALDVILGPKEVASRVADRSIEIAPLAYMRGRTLDRSFIILDEAQNTTVAQMKMFLTRIGQKSKMVVIGDRSQIDIRERSGFAHAQDALSKVSKIGFCRLKEQDIVRNRIIQDIIGAYTEYDKRETEGGRS